MNAAKTLRKAAEFQRLKEEAKDISLWQIALIRRMLLSLDRNLGLNGLVFFFQIDDFGAASGFSDQAVSAAKLRRVKFDALSCQIPLKPVLAISDIERASTSVEGVRAKSESTMSGIRVAGGELGKGPSYVVDYDRSEKGGKLVGFEDGDILVCPMVHPDWLGVVLRSGGVVSEVGGWLSHIAIVARENDIPMIVGSNAHDSVQPGACLTLGLKGEVVLADKSNAAVGTMTIQTTTEGKTATEAEGAVGVSRVVRVAE